MWSQKYKLDMCNGCGRSDIPHKALGLCKNCYIKSTGYAHQKNYSKAHRTQVNKTVREWNKFNPASVNKSRAKWRANNPHSQSQYLRNWRKRNRPQFCIICGEDRVVDWAHIIPAHKKGPVVHWNMIPLCPTHHRCFDRELLSPEELQLIQPIINSATIQFDLLPK